MLIKAIRVSNDLVRERERVTRYDVILREERVKRTNAEARPFYLHAPTKTRPMTTELVAHLQSKQAEK